MQWLRSFIQNRLPNNPAWRRALMVIGGVLAIYLIILMTHGGQNTIRAFIVEYQQFDYCFWWVYFLDLLLCPVCVTLANYQGTGFCFWAAADL